MKKILLIILISSILVNNTFAAVVSGRNNTEYKKEQLNQFATKDEVYEWAKDMQFWFDNGARIELMLKVASNSEVHGYVSDSWNRQEVLDEYERLKNRASVSEVR